MPTETASADSSATAPAPARRKRLSRRPRPPVRRPEHCLNCGMQVPETYVYCGNCGQENTPSAVSFRELWREAAEEFVKLDLRAFKTLQLLLFKPGFLTQEYVAGKRQRYISPFKLYLTVTALFAFVLFRTLQIDDTLMYAQQRFEAETAAAAKRKAAGKKQETSRENSASLNIKVNGEPAFSGPDGITFLNRPVTIGGMRFDPKSLPDTAAEYRVQQEKLPLEKRDSPARAFLTERVIRIKRDPYQAVQSLVSTALPVTMFCLLPFYALLMRVIYLRTGKLYAEHLVFALHTHTFLFLLLTVDSVLPFVEWGLLATLVIYPIYHLLAMRRFYAQGWAKTLFNAGLLFGGYGILLLFAISMAFLFSLIGLLIGA